MRDAILTCARKPTWVSLIYRTETTTKKRKTEKLKSKKRICSEVAIKVWGNHVAHVNLLFWLFKAHQHKAAGRKLGRHTKLWLQRQFTFRPLYYGKKSHLWAMERRWKNNVVSQVSSVIVVIRLPISCVSSMAISCHVPAVFVAVILTVFVILIFTATVLCVT